jgi:ABC-2 type transport system permease protein
MYAIFKKEFTHFFSASIGYLVVGLFLLFNSLLLWVFKGNWNIITTGFADLQNFFISTPWLFLLLIPAINMRMFNDEFTTGTIELLKTKPLSGWDIVFGKFLAGMSLIALSIIPTLVYAISIAQLALPENIDWGRIIGSYFGLLFLASALTSTSLLASILSKNQIIALLLGGLFSVLFYYGIDLWAEWLPNLPDFIQGLSLAEHYKSIGKGVIDSRDVVYFLSFTGLFLYLTTLKLDK